MIKVLKIIEIKMISHNIIKAMYGKHIAKINLNRKKLKEFSLKLEQDKDTFSLHTYSIEYFNLS